MKVIYREYVFTMICTQNCHLIFSFHIIKQKNLYLVWDGIVQIYRLLDWVIRWQICGCFFSSILIGIHASGDIFTYLRPQAKMTQRFLRYYWLSDSLIPLLGYPELHHRCVVGLYLHFQVSFSQFTSPFRRVEDKKYLILQTVQ